MARRLPAEALAPLDPGLAPGFVFTASIGRDWRGRAPAGALLSCFAKKVGKEGDPASPVGRWPTPLRCSQHAAGVANSPFGLKQRPRKAPPAAALLGGSDGLLGNTERFSWVGLAQRNRTLRDGPSTSRDQETADHREETAPNDGACPGKGGVGLRCANPTYPDWNATRQKTHAPPVKARYVAKARLSRRAAEKGAGPSGAAV